MLGIRTGNSLTAVAAQNHMVAGNQYRIDFVLEANFACEYLIVLPRTAIAGGVSRFRHRCFRSLRPDHSVIAMVHQNGTDFRFCVRALHIILVINEIGPAIRVMR